MLCTDASNLDDSISIATDQSDDDQFVMLDTADGAPFDDVFRDQGSFLSLCAHELRPQKFERSN